jgi:predicted nucleic acid-binding protein
VLNAIVREPARAAAAPDDDDQHVWDLVGAHALALLVTGDRRLLDRAPPEVSVVSPAAFVKLSLSGSG